MRLEQSFVLFTLQGKSRTVWKMDRIQPFFSFATSNSQIQSLFKRSRAQTIIKVGQDGAQSTLKIDWKAFIWMQGFNVQFDEYYTLIAFNYFYQIYIFNSFLWSERLLNTKLLNIYLIEVGELDIYNCIFYFRCAQIMSIENELYKYKTELHNAQLESESDKKRIDELEEENLQLQMSSKSSISESQSILAEMENMKNFNPSQDTNILTEQLGEGMTRIHRLELELKRLRQENEDLKLDKFRADANKMLALETENKKLSLSIAQLQKTNAKDVENNANMQQEVRSYEKQSHQLEQKMAALKEAEEQYKIEKETIIENLNKQVDSMKKRQVWSCFRVLK